MDATEMKEAEYPQCEKWGEVCDQASEIVAFVEWMSSEHGAHFAVRSEQNPYFDVAINPPLQDLVMRFYGVDPVEIERERRAIITAIREAPDGR